MRAAPVGEGGLLPAGAAAVRSEWEGSESRCRGDRALQSSGPLEAAAVAELQVALALRGCRKKQRTALPRAPPTLIEYHQVQGLAQ